MIHLTNERHFFTGALWATIGVMVTVVIAQLLRDYAPESIRLIGIFVLVAWIFLWFGNEKTANFVYRVVDVLLKRTEERQCQK